MASRDDKSAFANIDWVVIGIYLTLMLFGWMNIYASAYQEAHPMIWDFTMNYGKQMVWILAACLIAFTILLIDPKFFTAFAFPIYGIFMLILAGVLVVGVEIKGARSWYDLGAFSLQPTEFAKFATSLAMAKYLSRRETRVGDRTSLFWSGVILLIPVLLILLQPDVGSMLVYAAFVFVLYREGHVPVGVLLFAVILIVLFSLALVFDKLYVLAAFAVITMILYIFIKKKKKELFLLFGTFVVCSAFIFSVDYTFNHVLAPHHKDRINILYGKTVDPKGVGYNVNQSKIAIGSGGFIGKGYLQGTQTKYDFVPEQTTDFIFCTVGEEWGFVGSSAVIGLYIFLFFRLIYLAERQRSAFSRIYGYCVLSILMLHFIINIGMALGVLPVIGIPLPLFSYGGSSLWGFTILLFIFLKQDAYRLQLI